MVLEMYRPWLSDGVTTETVGRSVLSMKMAGGLDYSLYRPPSNLAGRDRWRLPYIFKPAMTCGNGDNLELQVDALAAAVRELSQRQQMLLSSRFLRLGWRLRFGKRP